MNQSSYFSPISEELLKKCKAPESLKRDPTRTIYTNRTLDLNEIKAVGFDMDYTLANYHKKSMENLQYKQTIDYLVKKLNYPATLYQLNYDSSLSIRGLVLDKRRGHLLKMDMHGNVWRAMHGYRHLSSEEFNKIYKHKKIKITKDYASLDSLFAIPEASLFCDLVNLFSKDTSIKYGKLFEDIRSSIDVIHSDGSLKAIISKDLSTYIESHPDIGLMLHKLRSSGKKVFLLTNSHLNYTETVMSYLLDNWHSYFDFIITASQKPAFFTEKRPFKQLQPGSQHRIFEGGNIHDFEKIAQVRGSEILYVGDHIYGDIVRSKKSTLWRTCLIVEELPKEIEHYIRYKSDLEHMSNIDSERLKLDSDIGEHRVLLAYLDAAKQDTEAAKLRKEMEKAKKYLAYLDDQMNDMQDAFERRFHPFWGELFHEHHDLSRFGTQVRGYSCIYTGKVTNLLHYSPLHSFRKSSELMSHDQQFHQTI
ncbi:MAG: HAD-IG family 5'-nucleotidase [Deltaproteobacteria bacterium]|nr:HAD-IG family 5'-nucleotidase [Deltaproteobacteria bacterium]